jgi:hypothetical protein
MNSAKFSPEPQMNNELHESSRDARLQGPTVVGAMTSTVKLIQEELWIREWENKNARGSDEQGAGGIYPTSIGPIET